MNYFSLNEGNKIIQNYINDINTISIEVKVNSFITNGSDIKTISSIEDIYLQQSSLQQTSLQQTNQKIISDNETDKIKNIIKQDNRTYEDINSIIEHYLENKIIISLFIRQYCEFIQQYDEGIDELEIVIYKENNNIHYEYNY
jgi:hypothetical protein